MSNLLYNRVKESFSFTIDERMWQLQRLVVGGLATFSLIIVQDFITTKIEDTAEWISMVAFAIAIPVLVLFILFYSIPARPMKTSGSTGLLFMGGILIDIFGLDAAFWHVSWVAGLLFMVSGLVAYKMYMANSIEAEQKHPQTLATNQPPQPPTS